MWIFGHLGLGSKIAEPLAKRLPFGWLLVGTLLPDLIDKPLYYVSSWITGRHGAEIGLISCTRTFGHTALFVIALTVVAWVKKSKPIAALALGVATHFTLDGFEDFWTHRVMGGTGESSSTVALLFPFYLQRFSAQPYSSLLEHLKSGTRPFLLVSETIGAMVLGWTLWKNRRRFNLTDRIGSVLKKSRSAQ